MKQVPEEIVNKDQSKVAVDANNLRGIIIAETVADRNSRPADFRKLGAICNTIDTGFVRYIGTDLTDVNWQDPANWEFVGYADVCAQSDVEKAIPTENVKVVTPLRAWQGFVYWINNTLFNDLPTVSKTIFGAINEIWNRFTKYENITASQNIENRRTYFCDTTGGAITLTAPAVVDSNFTFAVYKTSSIDTPDVTVVGTGGVFIGGASSQIVQGENEGFSAAADGSDYNIVQDNRDGILRKLTQSSGQITQMSVTKNPDETLNFGACNFVINDVTNLKKPVSKMYRFAGASNVVVNNRFTCGTTNFYIDSSGNITQLTNSSVPPKNWRNPIRIAIAIHSKGDGTLSAWFPFAIPMQNPGARLSSVMSILGAMKTGITLSGSATTLQLSNNAGYMYIAGVRTTTDPLNPDESPIMAHNPYTSIQYYTRSARLADKTAFDPTSYNPTANTVSTIPTNDNYAVIHRAYIDVTGGLSIQYGQVAYSSFADALAAFVNGSDPFEANPIFNNVAILVANIISIRGATNFSSANIARIVNTDKFGASSTASSSSEVITLQKAYLNSTQPQILTTLANGAMQVKAGTATLAAAVFEVLSNAGAKILEVTGEKVNGIKALWVSVTAPTGYTSTDQQSLADELAANTLKGNTTYKTTPVDADSTGIWDSVANSFKRLTFANLKAYVLDLLGTDDVLNESTLAGTTLTDTLDVAESAAVTDITSDDELSVFRPSVGNVMIPYSVLKADVGTSVNGYIFVSNQSELDAALALERESVSIYITSPINNATISNIYPKNVLIDGESITFAGIIFPNIVNYSTLNITFRNNIVIEKDVTTGDCLIVVSISGAFTMNFRRLIGERVIEISQTGSATLTVNTDNAPSNTVSGGAIFNINRQALDNTGYYSDFSIKSGNNIVETQITNAGDLTITLYLTLAKGESGSVVLLPEDVNLLINIDSIKAKFLGSDELQSGDTYMTALITMPRFEGESAAYSYSLAASIVGEFYIYKPNDGYGSTQYQVGSNELIDMSAGDLVLNYENTQINAQNRVWYAITIKGTSTTQASNWTAI